MRISDTNVEWLYLIIGHIKCFRRELINGVNIVIGTSDRFEYHWVSSLCRGYHPNQRPSTEDHDRMPSMQCNAMQPKRRNPKDQNTISMPKSKTIYFFTPCAPNIPATLRCPLAATCIPGNLDSARRRPALILSRAL
jgi:hypothetical protein